MKVALKNVEGKKVGEVDLAEAMFGIEPNRHAIHQVVRMQRAAARAGTASTKTRREVRVGAASPGGRRGPAGPAPAARARPSGGGGLTFGPKPRDYSFRVPKKVRRLAFLSALSAAARDERIAVLEDFALDVPSTRTGADILGKLDLDGRVMIVVADDDLNLEKSFRNLVNVETFLPNELNTYDLLRFDRLLFLKGALDQLQGDGGDEGSS